MKEMRELVAHYDLGRAVSEHSVEAVNAAVDDMLQADLTRMRDNALLAAAKNSWEHPERKMISDYKRILAAPQPCCFGCHCACCWRRN